MNTDIPVPPTQSMGLTAHHGGAPRQTSQLGTRSRASAWLSLENTISEPNQELGICVSTPDTLYYQWKFKTAAGFNSNTKL